MNSNLKIRLEWKPQDAWIGAFWKRTPAKTDIWICLLPCVPIHIVLWRVECPRCGALVKRTYMDSANVIEACCVHCAWNPAGCRCRFGQYGKAEDEGEWVPQ